MVPYNHTEFIDTLTSLVKRKFIPMSRIDDAVKRILRVKFTMGLFENPYADYSLEDKVGAQAHRDLAREAVRKSLVLLKNGENADNPVIPLPKKANRILVTGTHANDLGAQCGGWTITWQGLLGNNNTFGKLKTPPRLQHSFTKILVFFAPSTDILYLMMTTTGTTILGAVSNTVDSNTEIVYKKHPDADFVESNKFDYAIVVVGEPPYAETYGDSQNLTIPEPGPSIISSVCGQVKCVVILISGRPLMIEPYVQQMDAVVAAWLPGSEGQGIADLLYGDYGFTGTLARSWFRTVEQLPLDAGDENYNPLFPIGYGLTTQPVGSN